MKKDELLAEVDRRFRGDLALSGTETDPRVRAVVHARMSDYTRLKQALVEEKFELTGGVEAFFHDWLEGITSGREARLRERELREIVHEKAVMRTQRPR